MSNTAPNGSALMGRSTLYFITDSIVAFPRGGGTLCRDVQPTDAVTTSIQFGDTSCGAPITADPKLGPLSQNGGSTPTFAIAATSPAINVGGSFCPPVDQRGAPRPFGAACDIGAYELGATLPIPCSVPRCVWIPSVTVRRSP